MTKVSTAGDMIIQHYDFEVLHRNSLIYKGNTHFGFFSAEALSRQAGLGSIMLPGLDNMMPPVDSAFPRCRFADEPPYVPKDGQRKHPDASGDPFKNGLFMPGKALRMVDTIDRYEPLGGPISLGYVLGGKKVDSREWFFDAHFLQDPVCPGSLGIESFLQLLKWVAMQRWSQLQVDHCFELPTAVPHQWTYRGQITPSCQKVEVEAVITKIEEKPDPVLWADGLLKVDGLCIYKMDNYGLKLIPGTNE
jgi:3-hydroxymyristoyl/3-hydroxydecanoyl-(acyl carrier protein) dehydratase